MESLVNLKYSVSNQMLHQVNMVHGFRSTLYFKKNKILKVTKDQIFFSQVQWKSNVWDIFIPFAYQILTYRLYVRIIILLV